MPKKTRHKTRPQQKQESKKIPGKGFFKTWAERITGLSESLAVLILVAIIILFIVDIFLIASLLSDLTGRLGRTTRDFIVFNAGGGFLLILLFVLYILMSAIFGRKVPNPLNQTAGVLLLYFCITLTLGLMQMPPAIFRPRTGSILDAGNAGRLGAEWLFMNLGPLGTTLVGMTAISFTLYFFGFISPFKSAYKYLADRVTTLFEEYDASSADEEDGDSENESDDGFDEDGDAEFAEAHNEGESKADKYSGGELPFPEDVLSVDEMEPDEGDDAEPGQFPPPFEVFGRADEEDDGITEEMAR
ncbi:MAG: hypothetical protein FWE55_04900, partial [Synergistaceae bacterium]|nr:hypothetical protein [Synergistaceae bacterium]